MSARFARGLVVGKFCPLHHGHQLLIDSALQRCDEVVVVSYTLPEFDHCGPENRERWIAELFPGVIQWVIDDQRLQQLCLARGLVSRCWAQRSMRCSPARTTAMDSPKSWATTSVSMRARSSAFAT
jgi:cytidyltransferase-like protein